MDKTDSGSDSGSSSAATDAEAQNYNAINTILNSLDALVYVADMETHDVLFFNEYGLSEWGALGGRKCYELLQAGQSEPCAFCTNDKLLDSDGNPTGVYVWEFQNTQNGRWYQCRDQAIRWTDGRLVRMEIATDITDRKQMEQELAAAKALAEKRAATDELTGLNNRRAFFSLGSLVIHQALRSQQLLSVIMFDLDHFKQVNDRWGHAAGDVVLKHLAGIAGKTVRASDVLARLGGEEFAVLLPDTDPEQARMMAERMRVAIENQEIHFEGDEIRCTASFGIANIDVALMVTDENPDPEDLLSELLRLADDAMLQAKRCGRNCLQLAD